MTNLESSSSRELATTSELAGMAWWNALSELERGRWITRAGTGVVADAWAMRKELDPFVTDPVLQAVVSDAVPDAKHTRLFKAIRSADGYGEARLARSEGDAWLAQRKVLTAAGDLVHDDHQAWIGEQLAQDAGSVAVTAARLRALDYRLSVCSVVNLQIMVDRGGRQDNFAQLTVEHLTETIERHCFDKNGGWRAPRHLRDLIEEAEQGPELAQPDRAPVGASRYRLRQVVDIGTFIRLAEAVHVSRQTEGSQRQLSVTDGQGNSRLMSGAEIDPDWNRYAARERRLIDDWTLSSAGRSGARLCEHWAFNATDYTDPRGEQWVSFIPQWTQTKKLAKIERRPASHYELFGKLETLDRRVGVPFAWFFYMLHGNRVQPWAGDVILKAAEHGQIVLPEHDYRVLKRWSERPYGF